MKRIRNTTNKRWRDLDKTTVKNWRKDKKLKDTTRVFYFFIFSCLRISSKECHVGRRILKLNTRIKSQT